MPERIQRLRKRGWRMPPNTVFVGRPTRWGNPFPDDCFGGGWAVELFDRMVNGGEIGEGAAYVYAYAEQVAGAPGLALFTHEDVRRELCGKNLACWCPLDRPCHADVLLELANRDALGEMA